jgi:hypothetical protein
MALIIEIFHIEMGRKMALQKPGAKIIVNTYTYNPDPKCLNPPK